MDAKSMSDAIRMKRKAVKKDGLENMIDTAAGPQMNPQDIYNLKHEAQIKSTLGEGDESEAPSDPADPNVSGTSQDMAELKKSMKRLEKILGSLKVG